MRINRWVSIGGGHFMTPLVWSFIQNIDDVRFIIWAEKVIRNLKADENEK